MLQHITTRTGVMTMVLALQIAAAVVVESMTMQADVTRVRAMSMNVQHGDHLAEQLDFINAHNSEIVYLEEVMEGHEKAYVTGMEARTRRPWNYQYTRHCRAGGAIGRTCPPDHLLGEGVMLLTTLPVRQKDGTLLWGSGGDDWTDARAAVHLELTIGRQVVQVFGTHLAAGDTWKGVDLDTVRREQADALKSWIDGFGSGPRLITGDFNAEPGEPAHRAMGMRYTDVWALLHPTDAGNSRTAATFDATDTPNRRIDYWFTQPSNLALQIERPSYPAKALSDHYALTVTIGVPSNR